MVLSGTGAIALEWMFVGLASLFVLLRCYVRFIRQRDWTNPGDSLVILALFLFAACCACDTFTNQLGLMQPNITYSGDLTAVNPNKEQAVMVLKTLYASALPYYTELWLIKVALLLFYYSVIPAHMKGQRIALHIVSGVVAVSFVAVLLVNAFACLPVQRNWSLDKKDVCFSFAKLEVFLFSVACNVITDLMIFSLPFPLLPTLRLVKRSQLYGLIFIFGLGFLCIVASVSRCIALAHRATVTEVAVWTAAECSTGLMVACSPALRILVRNKRWRKGYSSRSRSRSKTDNKSNGLNTIGGTQRNGGTGANGERRSKGNVLDAWSRLDDDDMRISPEPKSVISIRGGGSGSGSKITTASSSTTRVDETAEIGMRDLDRGPKDKTSFYDDKGEEAQEEGRNSEVSLAREQDIAKIV